MVCVLNDLLFRKHTLQVSSQLQHIEIRDITDKTKTFHVNTKTLIFPGCEREMGKNLLEACGNNLEMAVNMHMENGKG